jgi:hypothetical protein
MTDGQNRKRASELVGLLSGACTGMSNTEMSCALPGTRVDALIEQLRKAGDIDGTDASYAAADGRRFARAP